MQAIRRRLVFAMLLSGLAGCAHTPPVVAPRVYTETVSSLLMSEDGQHIAAIGKRHHYIFDAPPLVVRAVRSPLHPRLSASFSPFHVDASGKVSGSYTLDVAGKLSADEQRDAQVIGLVPMPDGHWGASGTLLGQRYTGWTYDFGKQRERLNRSYTVTFINDATVGERMADDAATPIRVAADGVQLIYYAPLAPIIIPMIFATKARDH